MKKTKLFLVEDHELVRKGVRSIIDMDQSIDIIGEYDRAQKALEAMGQGNIPDIILMDISMPEMTGLEASKLIGEKYPEVKIIILSMYKDEEYVMEGLNFNIAGYVVKDSVADEILVAIEKVNEGGKFFSREVIDTALNSYKEIKKEKKKIQLWFFMDASGSCAGYHERFVQAARSVPCSPRDPFEVRLFSFDVRCYELAEAEIKGGGGTSFVCIEKYIREKMSEESIHYPESVWVLTDGMGDNVQPAIPENWHFFLTMQYTSCIPSQSHRHMLDNYE